MTVSHSYVGSDGLIVKLSTSGTAFQVEFGKLCTDYQRRLMRLTIASCEKFIGQIGNTRTVFSNVSQLLSARLRSRN